ncbi:MAG: SDR family oxidoreductase [Nitrosotalea sp.]
MAEKILIIGLGFLGNTIFQQAPKFNVKPFGTHKLDLDICSIESIEKTVEKTQPDCIINCAALTNLDQIESSPTAAYAVNSQGAKNVAIVSLKKKIKLIHISTDSVFDGKKGMYDENDLPNPINEYAKSKKIGEDFIREIYGDAIMVRTNFYGNNQEGKFLFNWILKNLQQKKSITGFDDVIFNPLEIENLSAMIIELTNKDLGGLIHLSSDEIMSKYQFAKKIAHTMQLDENLIKMGKVEEANFIAKRPLNTSLSNKKARKILETRPVTLEEWLTNKFR